MATSSDVVTVRMQGYLSLPLVQRCRELAILIDECSTTELQHVFPILIDSLFGLSNRVGWGLHSISLKHNPHEYETLCQFLSPQGPIFSLCYKLLPDCYLKYHFPVSYLPAKIRSMLEDGIIPPFYSDKIKDDQSSRISSALSMNPFEYYVFHFAYHLTNPWLQMQQTENVWMNWETAYVQLAHSYLYHFLPRDNSSVLPMIGPYVKKTPPRKLMQSPESKRLQTPRLLRTSILSPVSTTPQGVPQQQCLPQVWRSETVVQVFLDFWLEYTDDDQASMHVNQSVSGSLPRRSIHSGEHIRLVRAFIKTLHEFANSARGDKSAMDELKRVILPSVQGKIYVFLRKAIHHWPLDSSFRLILEAWLSFIQPWRYVPEIGYTNERKTEEEERGKIHDPSRWMYFVANNLLAYTAIFQQLLPRFMRTDLVTPKNALMLFRVTKVFAQPYLAQMLSEAESCMDETHLSRGKISTNQWSAIVRQQIIEFEGPTYQYVPMFSTATLSQIVWFLSTIKQAHLTAASIVEALEKRRSERRFLLSVWEFFNGEDSASDEIGLSERRRVPGFLASAQQQLIDIFQIKMDDIPLGIVVPDQEYHDSILSTSFCHQSHDSSLDVSRHGVCVPRLQFRKGPDLEVHTHSSLENGSLSELRSSQNCYYIKYKGDPELQPVRTNEFAFLVRKLYRISEYINTKYSREITSSYYRTDFCGRVMRRILRPPTTVEELPKRTNNGFTKATSREIPPRLSLRPLASHNLMVAMFVGTFIFWTIGYGTAGFFIIAFTVWILNVLIRAACEPWFSRSDVNLTRSNASAIERNIQKRSLNEIEESEQIRRMLDRSHDETVEHRLH